MNKYKVIFKKMITFRFMNGEKVFLNPTDFFWEKNDNFFSHIITMYPNKEDLIHIFEDHSSALSIIHSLKANNLILMKDTSLEVLLELSEKWCVDQWLIDRIKERISIDKKNTYEKLLKNYKFKCDNCKTGYDIFENEMNSCKTHRFTYSHSHLSFSCCGGQLKDYCITGFHTPEEESIQIFKQLAEIEKF